MSDSSKARLKNHLCIEATNKTDWTQKITSKSNEGRWGVRGGTENNLEAACLPEPPQPEED